MSKGLRKRINDIENCMLQPIVAGSTKLDITELPEAEQKLYVKALNIQHNLEHFEHYEPSPTEFKIMSETTDRITQRVLDIFTTWAKAAMCFNDKTLEFLFSLRGIAHFTLTHEFAHITSLPQLVRQLEGDFQGRRIHDWFGRGISHISPGFYFSIVVGFVASLFFFITFIWQW